MVGTEGQGRHRGTDIAAPGPEQGPRSRRRRRARGGAALPWRGLKRPRMRDKGGTLTLPFTRGNRGKMAREMPPGSVAPGKEMGILEGSITPTGVWEKWNKVASNEAIPSLPRARGGGALYFWFPGTEGINPTGAGAKRPGENDLKNEVNHPHGQERREVLQEAFQEVLR